jgi:hypothetical protein
LDCSENDFLTFFNTTAGVPQVDDFNYHFGGELDMHFARVTLTDPNAPQVPPTAPEPATWAMMLFGFGAAGLALRRRRGIAALAA